MFKVIILCLHAWMIIILIFFTTYEYHMHYMEMGSGVSRIWSRGVLRVVAESSS